MKIYFGLLLLALAIALTQSGCGFYIGIDYNGKTDKSNVSESPNFRNAKGGLTN